MEDGLLTVSEAARAKGVSRAALYAAVGAGRIPHLVVGGRIALRAVDLAAYAPTRYGGRPGAKGRGGRPEGRAMDARARANISEGQKRRWAGRRQGEGPTGQAAPSPSSPEDGPPPGAEA